MFISCEPAKHSQYNADRVLLAIPYTLTTHTHYNTDISSRVHTLEDGQFGKFHRITERNKIRSAQVEVWPAKPSLSPLSHFLY